MEFVKFNEQQSEMRSGVQSQYSFGNVRMNNQQSTEQDAMSYQDKDLPDIEPKESVLDQIIEDPLDEPYEEDVPLQIDDAIEENEENFIKISTAYYHFGKKKITYVIDQSKFDNNLHYVFSFMYKKDDNLVLQGAQIMLKLCLGPQKSQILDFLLKSDAKQFNQLTYLINNSKNMQIQQECIKIMTNFVIWSKDRKKTIDLLKEQNLINSVSLVRILQNTFTENQKVNPFSKQQVELNFLQNIDLLAIERTQALIVFLSYLLKLYKEIFRHDLLDEIVSECIDLLEKIDKTQAQLQALKGLREDLNQFVAMKVYKSPSKEKFLSINHLKILRYYTKCQYLPMLAVLIAFDPYVVQELIRSETHLFVSEILTDDDSPIEQRLAGLQIYTKLSISQYDGSDSSNLTIALDSELIQSFIGLKSPFDILLLISVMIDNPNSRQLVLDQLDQFNFLQILLQHLKIGDQSACILTLAILLKNTQKLAAQILKVPELIGMINVHKCDVGILKAFIQQIVIYLGDKKLDQVFEIEDISKLVKGMREVYVGTSDKISVIDALIILRNTQSQHIHDIVNNLIFDDMLNHLEKQMIGFKLDSQNFALISSNFLKSLLIKSDIFQFRNFEIYNDWVSSKAVFNNTEIQPENVVFENKDEMIIKAMKDKEQKYLKQIAAFEKKHALMELRIQEVLKVNNNNLRSKESQTEIQAIGQDILFPKKEVVEEKKKTNQKLKPKNASLNSRLKDLEKIEKKNETNKDISEHTLQIKKLRKEIETLNKEIMIKDLTLQKVSSQSIPISNLFSEIAFNLEQDYQKKLARQTDLLSDIQNAYKRELDLVKNLTHEIQEIKVQNKQLLEISQQFEIKNKELTTKNEEMSKQESINMQIIHKMTGKKFEERYEEMYQEQQNKGQNDIEVLYPKMRDRLHYFDNLAAQSLLTEQNQTIIEQKIQIMEFETEIKDLKVEIDVLKQKVVNSSVPDFQEQPKSDLIMKQIEFKNLRQILIDQGIQGVSAEQIQFIYQEVFDEVNSALQYVNQKEQKFIFKENLLESYENIIKDLKDKHESTLFQIFMHLSKDRKEVLKFGEKQPSFGIQKTTEKIDNNFFDCIISNEYRLQHHKSIEYLREYSHQQFQENKRLRIKLQELEDQLVKYKKYVLLDEEQYEKILIINSNYGVFQGMEGKIIQYLFGLREKSEVKRLSKILDLLIRHNVHLEYQVSLDTTERLKNESHLIVEQREAVLRKNLVSDKPEKPYQFQSVTAGYQSLSSLKLQTLIDGILEDYTKTAKEHQLKRNTFK